MITFLLLFLGIFLTSLGLFFLILYLNLFSMGYTFFEFGKFITGRFECYLIIIGIVLIVITLERIIKR